MDIYKDEDLKVHYLNLARQTKRIANKMRMKLYMKEKLCEMVANDNYRKKMQTQMADYRADILDLEDEVRCFIYAVKHLDGTARSVRDARQAIRKKAKQMGLTIAARKGYQILMNL